MMYVREWFSFLMKTYLASQDALEVMYVSLEKYSLEKYSLEKYSLENTVWKNMKSLPWNCR